MKRRSAHDSLLQRDVHANKTLSAGCLAEYELNKYFLDVLINTGLDYSLVTGSQCYFYKVHLYLSVEPGSFCVIVSDTPPLPPMNGPIVLAPLPGAGLLEQSQLAPRLMPIVLFVVVPRKKAAGLFWLDWSVLFFDFFF